MRIGVIGAGGMGGNPARHLAKRGHHVSIANSRGPGEPDRVGGRDRRDGRFRCRRRQRRRNRHHRNPHEGRRRPSTGAVCERAEQRGRHRYQQLPSRTTRWSHQCDRPGYARESVGRATNRASVIKAFNNILATSLLEKGVPSGTKGRIALSVFGDSLDAKASVLRLVDNLGFDPVDGGDSDNSWRQQPGTPAYAGISKRLLSDARSPTPTGHESPNTAPNGRLTSGGISQCRHPTRETATVIERFNQAFVAHDGSLLVDLVSEDCVMESVEPAPDGTRYEGREACLAFWQRLAEDSNGSFAPEDVAVFGDRAIIRWRYRYFVWRRRAVPARRDR